ncbi:MAG: hypothetical protein [Olavius algarvensis Gamma 3 endosymbiont]|nr:MAG: hypothetical protein [Olavius algarvensis Gamma 3 endosymbiont]
MLFCAHGYYVRRFDTSAIAQGGSDRRAMTGTDVRFFTGRRVAP